jgi:hypothetical protein
MLPLPSDDTDELRLADWLELRALLADDKSSSLGDLERILTREDVFGGDREPLEVKLADVEKELEQRSWSAGGGYPFTLDGRVIRAADGWRQSSYTFCLCLSYMGCVQKRGSKTYPARIFEAIATEAARTYISSPGVDAAAVRFGHPRHPKELPAGFKPAVVALCSEHIREGVGWPPGNVLSRRLQPKDDGLDVVAWRDWPDKREGKLMLWGACAAGSDWEQKTGENQPTAFSGQWMASQPVTPILKAFFVPHRVHSEKWRSISLRAGLVFERCRISALVKNVPAAASKHGRPEEWLKSQLRTLLTA